MGVCDYRPTCGSREMPLPSNLVVQELFGSSFGMGKTARFLVLVFILEIAFGDATECNYVASKSTMVQLKNHLLCEYDPDMRSVKINSNKTEVNFQLTPHLLEYSNEEEIFRLHAWMGMTWHDSHLTWDKAQFDDIEWIPMESRDIWVPDVKLHNEWSGETSVSYDQAKCWVWSTGMIQWVVPAKLSTFCVPDNTWYPYSTMNCTIQFGSWSHSSDEIQLLPRKNRSLDENMKLKHDEWDLLKVNLSTWEGSYKYNSGSKAKLLSYHFILRRHAGVIRVTYVLPAVVFIVMTLTVLWLEPRSYERMIIANLNFICHLMCIRDLHWELPKSGFNTPKLIIFYESSLAIATFTLVLTTVLRHLQELASEPPVWISTITTSILRSRVGQILLIGILDPAVTAKIEVDADDNADLMQSSSKRSSWRYVTLLVGWLAFFGVLLAYIVLLSTCLPTYNSAPMS